MTKRTMTGTRRALCGASLLLALYARPSPAAEPTVVINEIRATALDWVELYNPGPLPADLSGWRLADAGADGSPRLAVALTFPRGTVVPPNGYVLAVAERGEKKRRRDQARVAQLCPGNGRCFRMSWGISKSRGDTLRLVGPDGNVGSEASYPGARVPKDKTWARQPDGSGAFTASDPTPGKPNGRK